MPTVLAIETSAQVGAVCVLRDTVATHEIVREEAKLSAWLLPAVDRALDRAAIALGDVDAIAFGEGPGAFTGVRTACATAQALAYACAKPLYAVNSMLALGESAYAQNNIFSRGVSAITVILDARMNEAFSATFSLENDLELGAMSTPTLSSMASLAPNETDHLVGSGALLLAHRCAFSPTRIEAIRALTHAAENEWALAIARITLARMKRGVTPINPRDAQPNYVRNNVAKTERERARDALPV